ncbi:MAG: DNA cytosine methyltransferase [Christensenellaceae bacterium]|jgi:DNA (cytosine-5)-methyltransferase 3A|nr:DNA cytosine methyltransferase [Christensenellaceae bacterium]
MIKFLIGGSPCTHWSIAQSKNRETEAEGIGWELFRNYLIAKERFKPDFFLYENNKSAAQPIKDQIAAELGAPLQYINSALVSAQRRERFYCHNFGDVPQPEDRGILLQDILERGESWSDKAYTLTTAHGPTPEDSLKRHTRNMVAEAVAPNRVGTWPDYQQQAGRIYGVDGKSVTLKATDGGGGAATGLYAMPVADREKAECFRASYDKCGKRNFEENIIRTKGYQGVPVRVGCLPNEKGELKPTQSKRIYAVDAKSVALQAATTAGGCSDKSSSRTGLYAVPSDNVERGRPVYRVEAGQIEIKGKTYPIKLPDGYYIIRKLSVTEACRLQTLPDDYCRAVSDTQAYRGLGNGWTAEVIIHLLRHALAGVPLDERIVVMSMYDGIGTGRYCFDQLGYNNIKYYAFEIDKYAMQIASSNYPDIVQRGDAFAVRRAGYFDVWRGREAAI